MRSRTGAARTILLFLPISNRSTKQAYLPNCIWSQAPFFCFCKNNQKASSSFSVKISKVKAEDRRQKKDRGQFFSFFLKDNAFPSSSSQSGVFCFFFFSSFFLFSRARAFSLSLARSLSRSLARSLSRRRP